MYKRPWIYIQNPFQTATSENYRLAVTISTYTDAALNAAKADAAILALYTPYHVLHLAYVAAYDSWLAQAGSQQGSTLNLTQLLDRATTHINDWDLAIQNVYRRGTPEYKTLLPNGHAPFNQGAQTSRIAAFKALSINLTSIAALVTTKTAVDTYYTLLDTANTTQKGSKMTTNSFSSNVEAARLAACEGLYVVLGGLMQHYSGNPAKIADYMDLENIRTGEQKDFTGHTLGGQITKIAKRTLADNQSIRLLNPGNVKIQFYLATRPTDTVGAKSVIANPGEDKTVIADDLGDVTTQHYLMVYNIDAIATAQWELIVV
jgi:hypothetical protein